MAILLVVINNFHIEGAGRASGPLETPPPLLVDADAVLTLAVPFQRFETVAAERGEVLQRQGRLETVEPQLRSALDAGEGLDPLPCGELPGALVPIADDHCQEWRTVCVTSSISDGAPCACRANRRESIGRPDAAPSAPP